MRPAWAGVRALVAQIDPQAPGLGLAGTRREHRDRSVVAMDHASGHDVGCDQLDKGRQQPGDVAEPFSELAAVDVEAGARADLGEPVERDMIAEFGDHDVGQETGIDHAARNREGRHRRLHHRFALPARAGGAYVAVDLDVAGHVAEHLGDTLAHVTQIGNATTLADIGRPVDDVAARKLCR
jgi:hypothetical protein